MALKLLAIIAGFVGLIAYANAAAEPPESGPSLSGVQRALLRSGYQDRGGSTAGHGEFVETWELQVPSKPHYHQSAFFYITSRGDQFLGCSHAESASDLPD